MQPRFAGEGARATPAKGMMISRMAAGTLLRRLSSGLTERRLRVHGLLLAICLWSVYCFDLSAPGLIDRHGLVKGTDFVHFYVLGSLALQHRGAALYNTLLQSAIAEQVVPGAQPLYFVALYGPQVSLLFAFFARLPYGWALLAWSLLSSVIYAVCCFAIWKTCSQLKPHRMTVVILALAYPAFFHLIAWGQTSAPALACFTVAYLALRSNRQFVAGLAIGLLIYKPQLGIVAILLFLVCGQWKALAGALMSAAAELSIGWIYYGTGVMRDYLNALLHVQKVLPYLEPRPYTTHSLRTFWSLIVPSASAATVLYVASAVLVLAISVYVWRSQASLSIRYSSMLLTTVLVAPHLTVYDLVILAPAFLLLADWGAAEDTSSSSQSSPVYRHPTFAMVPPLPQKARQRWGTHAAKIGHPRSQVSVQRADANLGHRGPLPMLLYLCYALPLIGPLSRYTHVQLSVVAFVGLAFFVGVAAVSNKKSPQHQLSDR